MIESEVLTWNSKVANAILALDWTNNRWWHITARVILIAYQKRFWGLLGHDLQEVRGIPLAHLALIRRSWATGRGRLLRQLSKPAP